MITSGNIYLIAKDFETTLNFYSKLFERDVISRNKSRYAIFQIDGLCLAVMNGKFDELHPDEVTKQKEYCSLYDDMGRIMDSPNCGKAVINICTDNECGE